MNKNYTIIKQSKKRSKKRILGTFFLVLMTLIIGFSIIFHCFYPGCEKQLKEEQEKRTVPHVSSENFLDITPLKKQVSELEQKIKQRHDECDDEYNALDVKTEDLYQKIIRQQTLKKAELKNQIIFSDYLHYLETKIKEITHKLTPNHPLELEEQHHLTETKLNQEKELINLKQKSNLFQTQEELNHILKGIIEKCKDENLTPNDKTNFTQEKAKFDNKLKACQQEIKEMVNKIKLKSKIISLTEEIKTETNETLKQLLLEEKALYQTNLENHA